MSRYDRGESRSPLPRPRNKRPREGDDDVFERSHHRGGHRDVDHDRRRRDEERPRKRRSLSPRSDNEDYRRRDSTRYRNRSPRRSKSHHNHRRPSPTRSRSPKALERSRAPLPPQNQAFDQERHPETSTPAPEKQKPNFAPSGKLAAASNTVQTAGQTIILKYHEPGEARKPPARDAWRMYVFKNDEIVDTIQLSEQSCWLFGREMAVCDIAIEHPSCSKQHAVVQFRYIEKKNEFGDKIGKVKPYVLDLESSKGTFVNEEKVPEAKYVELRDKDVVKFGHSRRDYVVQLSTG